MSTRNETGPEAVQQYLRADEPRGWMLLVNPFRRIEGFRALLLGLLVVAATVLVAVYGGIAYDGVADLHVPPHPLPPSFLALLPVTAWLIAAAVLGLSGWLFSRSRQRVVDYLGMVAVARFPMALLGVLLLPSLLGRYLEPINRLLEQNPPDLLQRLLHPPGLAALALLSLISVILVLWTAALTYFALLEASGMSKGRALVVFLGAALVAEVLSKLALIPLALALGLG